MVLHRQLKLNHKFTRAIFLVLIVGFTSPISRAEEGKQVAEELAKKYGCLGCHAQTKKIIGPAFRDIAEKYRQLPAAQQYLALRVKNGGSGIWGVVAMPANKNISDSDLEKIIQWVLNH
ncbi:cytochrome c551 [Polynucleobacter sp. SHI8]|uniref:c-type cytochrome n=1 Tax=unclassified Polynucleobacter TaxID=2640945 RepID=UPI0024913539|nr:MULTISPECIES: c-type cytochrome [unclassified Polynucleobacter]BDW09956.1 cytochrome c551 [Polynucleobacter sp. SHI2]BDW12402.1 cytochrome c551 [Polynucleobacter sp. SHI8]